jgi:hypothetical protein
MFDHDPRTTNDDERHREDVRDREPVDPRDAFVNQLDLPREREREFVHDRGRDYRLRGSESRALSLVGAFRVIPSQHLHDQNGRTYDPHQSDLRNLRDQGLVRHVPVLGHRGGVVVLTERGKHLLDARHNNNFYTHDRNGRGAKEDGPRQQFYAELKKPREVEHDCQIYAAYLREADRLAERGMRVERVVLDYELKRDYQRFLQERNRGRADSDGRPDRDKSEIEAWAAEHDLPCSDGHVSFPDARIEYFDQDDRLDHIDIEVVTVHYRGAHGASAGRSGCSTFRGSNTRTGGSAFDPDYASEMFR